MLEWVNEFYASDQRPDGSFRLTSSLMCLELSKVAQEAIKPYMVDWVPLVFIGLHDPDKDTAQNFADSWEVRRNTSARRWRGMVPSMQ